MQWSLLGHSVTLHQCQGSAWDVWTVLIARCLQKPFILCLDGWLTHSTSAQMFFESYTFPRVSRALTASLPSSNSVWSIFVTHSSIKKFFGAHSHLFVVDLMFLGSSTCWCCILFFSENADSIQMISSWQVGPLESLRQALKISHNCNCSCLSIAGMSSCIHTSKPPQRISHRFNSSKKFTRHVVWAVTTMGFWTIQFAIESVLLSNDPHGFRQCHWLIPQTFALMHVWQPDFISFVRVYDEVLRSLDSFDTSSLMLHIPTVDKCLFCIVAA